MIITRSPLRITLGGGGTDLPSYYREHGGFLIAAAIQKYVCITLHQTFVPELIIKYSKMERVFSIDEIQHPIIREAMRMTGVAPGRLEISSIADIPAGTGLGSSGAFTTALLKALHQHARRMVQPGELAEQACHIEIDLLGEPIGKQDQYIASFGGLTCFTFHPDGRVEAEPLRVDPLHRYNLEDSLLMFFTGFSRSASDLLRDQDSRTKKHDAQMIANLHATKQLGYESKAALESGDLDRLAELMNIHWEQKRKRSSNMSNTRIDEWYNLARGSGAMGGKIIGAGGGGFLLFVSEDNKRLRRTMREAGLEEVRLQFDFEGTKTVVES